MESFAGWLSSSILVVAAVDEVFAGGLACEMLWAGNSSLGLALCDRVHLMYRDRSRQRGVGFSAAIEAIGNPSRVKFPSATRMNGIAAMQSRFPCISLER